jgi:hypothetical protein
MIVLSVGMPRAGSGWHYNLIHDLMKTTGCADARDIRERYGLQSILTEVNSNIGVLSVRRLGMVGTARLMGNTFVIKAHAGPTIRFAPPLDFGFAPHHIHLPRPARCHALSV